MKLPHLFAAMTAGVLFAAAPILAQATGTVRVAVTNPARVFNDIQETKDLKDKMENDQKTFQAEAQARQQKIKDLQTARDALKPDSPQYSDRNKELMQMAIEFDSWAKINQANFEREQKLRMVEIFNRIAQTTTEVATAKGIDLVIAEQRQDIPEIDRLNMEQLRAVINARNVLHAAAPADITADVIADMDKKYKAGK